MPSNRSGSRWALGSAMLLSTLTGCDTSSSGDASSGGTPAGGAIVAEAPLQTLADDELVSRYGAAVWRVATNGCDWVGSGSAFAVDAHHLVTNHHVIAHDVGPEVLSPTGERIQGRVIGASPASDIAVIEVDEPVAVVVPWAPPDAVAAGERILAVGYPVPDLAFTVTAGEIVSFVGPDGSAEAMLTNAPINRGNSGGPALRADGSVAGVVTQMTNGDEHSAIVFAAATVQPLVSGFIAQPQDVVSDCGYGPDYEPPVPGAFDVPADPPRPPNRPVTDPLVIPTTPAEPNRPAPTAPPLAPTASTVPCPRGEVVLGADAITVEAVDGNATLWHVSIDGWATNNAEAPVLVSYAIALIDIGGQTTELYTDNPSPIEIEAAGWSPLPITGTVVADTEPRVQRLDLAYGWARQADESCPAPPSTAEFS